MAMKDVQPEQTDFGTPVLQEGGSGTAVSKHGQGGILRGYLCPEEFEVAVLIREDRVRT